MKEFEYKPSEATKLALFKLDLKLIALVIKTETKLKSIGHSRFPSGGEINALFDNKRHNEPEFVTPLNKLKLLIKNKPGLSQ